MNSGEIREIKITYKDGTEKTVTRGVCFSVYEEGETVKVSCDGRAGGGTRCGSSFSNCFRSCT